MEPEVKRVKLDTTLDTEAPTRVKGVAPIKKEFLIDTRGVQVDHRDDDAEEAGLERAEGDQKGNKKGKKNKKRGQNKNRSLAQKKEAVRYCDRERVGENECVMGDKCTLEHSVEKYLAAKLPDIQGVCPVWAQIGYCPSGVKCRWLGSHFLNGQLQEDTDKKNAVTAKEYNLTTSNDILTLAKFKHDFSFADKATKAIDDEQQANQDNPELKEKRDNYAAYFEGTVKANEKKRLDYDRKYVLSPLTTVGNLPYRRLMKTLGTDITFSEMALSLPIVQGKRSEWALPRCHSSEIPGFGIQIAGSKAPHAIKATQALAELTPQHSEINLNCGCPIDLLYRQGAGSALMENPARLLRILKGMSLVSGEAPITVKIRTGTKDGHPTAKSLVKRLVDEQQVHAITLHGRLRQQRYTREADWHYIKEVAALVKHERADKDIKPWIIGNGDVYSWYDWYDHVENQGVDTCMVARGALIKPWIFEEIESRQYLDKSATERLEYIKQYAHYGLDHWGSDQYGVEQTRRFLCEWLSFTYRYIPVGILEHMPPKLNDRPQPFQGRNELETLLASGNYKDWIKITEMFLGPTPQQFEFEPKHKSNAYEPATNGTEPVTETVTKTETEPAAAI